MNTSIYTLEANFQMKNNKVSVFSSRAFFFLLENPLYCGCAQQEVWEWLRDHQKMINEGNEVRSSLKCEQPPELRGRLFLELDPPTFCTTPLVLKLAIQDIQPFSVVVSWQSRNHSGVYGYKIAYNTISTMEYNQTVSTRNLDSIVYLTRIRMRVKPILEENVKVEGRERGAKCTMKFFFLLLTKAN